MIPIARTKKLLIQDLGEEVVVYDQERDAIYCLNSLAARVWYYCDGQNTIEDIAEILTEELEIPVGEQVDSIGMILRSLEELESFHLIEEYISKPIAKSGISRRRMMKKTALVSGFAMGTLFPTIKSIVAPLPAMAGSGEIILTTGFPTTTNFPTTTPV